MADGTYLNNVEARHIHKSNAREAAEDAESMVDFYRERLLVLSASSPVDVDGEPWHEYVQREIPTLIDEMLDEAWKRWAAQYILDWPDDCKDEWVDADWPDKDGDT